VPGSFCCFLLKSKRANTLCVALLKRAIVQLSTQSLFSKEQPKGDRSFVLSKRANELKVTREIQTLSECTVKLRLVINSLQMDRKHLLTNMFWFWGLKCNWAPTDECQFETFTRDPTLPSNVQPPCHNVLLDLLLWTKALPCAMCMSDYCA